MAMSEGNKQKLAREKVMLASSEDDFNKAVRKIFLLHSQRTGVKAIEPRLIFGDKRAITTLFLRINGLKSLQKLRKENLAVFEKLLNEYFSTLIDKIRKSQGVAELVDDTILVIFNAIKQYSHDISAIKVATEIRDESFRFNERYKAAAIELSISAGINTGEAILSTIGEDKVLKYLPSEDTTFISKKLEEKAAANEILLSDNTYSRLKNSIEAKKISPLLLTNKKAVETYSIEQISLRAKYRDYVNNVVKDFKNPYP